LRVSQESDGDVDLVATGPLTNIGLALRRAPDVLTRFRSVTIMGGSGPFAKVGVFRGPDANIRNDVLAAKMVFAAARSQMRLVGGDIVFPEAVLYEADVEYIESGEGLKSRVAASILE